MDMALLLLDSPAKEKDRKAINTKPKLKEP
jgi:hypothetical protein